MHMYIRRELGIGIVAYSPLGCGFFASGPKIVENLAQNDHRKVCERYTFFRAVVIVNCATLLNHVNFLHD